jgi:hypothetical protein
MIMNDELVKSLKGFAMASFKLLAQHLLRGTEENIGTPRSEWSVFGQEYEVKCQPVMV